MKSNRYWRTHVNSFGFLRFPFMSDIIRNCLKQLLLVAILINYSKYIKSLCYTQTFYNKINMTDKKIKNKIKSITNDKGASSRLVSLWVNVDYTTVSQWNSNNYQPNSDKLNKIGELLEVDNRDLMEPQNRIDTGLAKALQQELDRLHKSENIPYEIEQINETTGKIIKVNNPKLIKALKEFAKKHENKLNPL